MKFKTKEVLRVGEYLSTTLSKSEPIVSLYKGKLKVGQVEIDNPAIFNRRNLKAVVTSKSEDEYTVKIIRFADIHRHSGYSLLDGGIKISELVKKTEYVGALTDHGNMYGFLEYYKEMKKAGKQPILGFEAYMETIDGGREGNHLILLAKNKEGYKNLIKLTSMSFENFYKHPHLSYEMLETHNEGIIATSACLGGEIARLIAKGDMKKAKDVAKKFVEIFKDDFYLEIQNHNIGEEEKIVNKGLKEISKELGIKLVAATDSHYLNKEDRYTHEILLCLQTGKTMEDAKRMRFSGDGYHIHTADEMDERFKGMEDALDNTLEIAEKCSEFELDLGNIYMPKFKVPEGYTDESYLEVLTWDGFKDRFNGKPELLEETYQERIKYELSVIKKMGYSSYFLIVWDFIKYARDKGIVVGPGRGSAAGSLVSYCLGIVDLDPIPYNLLFERFLNPERISMPDVDVDFCYERRDEVIQYVRRKYGSNAVSKIITFGTLGARSVIRDVTRVTGKAYSLGDKLAKLVPIEPDMTLTKALEMSPELKDVYDTNPEAREIIDTAMKLEGLPRHSSVHACGLVVSDGPIDNYIPEAIVTKDGEKERTSQVTMTEVEELGLLKMDFLGLRTLTVISKSINLINATSKNKLKYKDIPLFDPYVYRDISKGKSYGVFQIESPGMRSFMSELFSDAPKKIRAIEKKYSAKGYKVNFKTDKEMDTTKKEEYIQELTNLGKEFFERIIAGLALFRPGPMDYIPDYLEGMKNPQKIKYDHPKLEPILKSTYGQIVYQEQVMQIVQSLAGYSMSRADLVRRAMGKKKDEIMKEERDYFINGKLNKDGSIDVNGCVRNGIPKEVAEVIWQKMELFSKYAFNKSHAAAYAVLSAITGWLKYYYPVEFMTATLNSFLGKAEEIKGYLAVCKEMKIKILPPDVNKSEEAFSVSGKSIVFGFKGIKNIASVGERIILERANRGEFKNYQDFAERMAIHEKIDKKVLDGLIYSGALDSFEGTRNAKLKILPLILQSAKIEKNDHLLGQVNIFEIVTGSEHLKTIETPNIEEMDKRFKLEKEKEYAGFYVTEHPMEEFAEELANHNVVPVNLLTLSTSEDESASEERDGQLDISYLYPSGKRLKVAGIITNLKTYYTKKDSKPLSVFKVEDMTGEIDAICFTKQREEYFDKLLEGKIVVIDGEYKNDERGVQIVVNTILDIETLSKSKNTSPKYISIEAKDKSQLEKLNVLISNNKGNIPVYVSMKDQKMKASSGLNYDLSIVSKLSNLFGSENIKYIN